MAVLVRRIDEFFFRRSWGVHALIAFDFLFLSNQLVEIDLDKGQISKLCSVVNKKPQQKHPDTIRCPGAE